MQAANAAKMNASAVLIYPDPDVFFRAEPTPLFGHVSEHGQECERMKPRQMFCLRAPGFHDVVIT